MLSGHQCVRGSFDPADARYRFSRFTFFAAERRRKVLGKTACMWVIAA